LANRRFLVLIVGPTAVGKTDFCLKLANFFNSEIISCDSRQFYREMNLGTAKPSESELSLVRHHFINSLSVEDVYDVKKFENEAIDLLENLFQKHQILILTGGSGLFADAVIDGLDEMPQIDERIRKELIDEYNQKGLTFLQDQVALLDPVYFGQVDRQNPQRLMRAIEVFRGTGKPFSSFRVKAKVKRDFEVIKIGLERPRNELYARIDLRMDQMITNGLFEEASALFPKRHLNALQTVGYSEIFGYLEGSYDREEAIRLLKRNSRRYAKRQLTWFKRDQSIHWFEPSQEEEILQYIKNQIG
jgi:tRNA dimethylallyltransferase